MGLSHILSAEKGTHNDYYQCDCPKTETVQESVKSRKPVLLLSCLDRLLKHFDIGLNICGGEGFRTP